MAPVDPGPRPPIPVYTPMEAIDFRPVKHTFLLIIFLVGYGALGTLGGVLAWDTFTNRIHWADLGGWTLAAITYLGMFWFVGTWLTFTRRTRFSDAGIARWTIGGKRYFIPWDEIRSARASFYKGSIELVLRYGPRNRRLHIMLTDYRHSRRLYDEMQRRMAVPLGLSQGALGRLQ